MVAGAKCNPRTTRLVGAAGAARPLIWIYLSFQWQLAEYLSAYRAQLDFSALTERKAGAEVYLVPRTAGSLSPDRAPVLPRLCHLAKAGAEVPTR